MREPGFSPAAVERLRAAASTVVTDSLHPFYFGSIKAIRLHETGTPEARRRLAAGSLCRRVVVQSNGCRCDAGPACPRVQNASRKRMRNRRPLILLFEIRANACLAIWRSSAT